MDAFRLLPRRTVTLLVSVTMGIVSVPPARGASPRLPLGPGWVPATQALALPSRGNKSVLPALTHGFAPLLVTHLENRRSRPQPEDEQIRKDILDLLDVYAAEIGILKPDVRIVPAQILSEARFWLGGKRTIAREVFQYLVDRDLEPDNDQGLAIRYLCVVLVLGEKDALQKMRMINKGINRFLSRGKKFNPLPQALSDFVVETLARRALENLDPYDPPDFSAMPARAVASALLAEDSALGRLVRDDKRRLNDDFRRLVREAFDRVLDSKNPRLASERVRWLSHEDPGLRRAVAWYLNPFLWKAEGSDTRALWLMAGEQWNELIAFAGQYPEAVTRALHIASQGQVDIGLANRIRQTADDTIPLLPHRLRKGFLERASRRVGSPPDPYDADTWNRQPIESIRTSLLGSMRPVFTAYGSPSPGAEAANLAVQAMWVKDREGTVNFLTGLLSSPHSDLRFSAAHALTDLGQAPKLRNRVEYLLFVGAKESWAELVRILNYKRPLARERAARLAIPALGMLARGEGSIRSATTHHRNFVPDAPFVWTPSRIAAHWLLEIAKAMGPRSKAREEAVLELVATLETGLDTVAAAIAIHGVVMDLNGPLPARVLVAIRNANLDDLFKGELRRRIGQRIETGLRVVPPPDHELAAQA